MRDGVTMRLAIALLAAALLSGSSAGAFSFSTGGCATGGCAAGEDWLHSNANEVDAALDALEAVAFDADVTDLIDGTLSGSKVGTGINAANITTGQVAIANGGTGASSASAARTALGLVLGTDVQAFDADLSDLADGSLSGSKVGAGIDAANVTTGTLPDARLPSSNTMDSELRALTISGSDPTDGSSTCVEGDMWLNHSGTGKMCYCVDDATDDWSCTALTAHP